MSTLKIQICIVFTIKPNGAEHYAKDTKCNGGRYGPDGTGCVRQQQG
jgi:hypothetical protein